MSDAISSVNWPCFPYRTGDRLRFMSIEELKSVVTRLSAEELDRFLRWFDEFLADQWDRKIEADILAGRLDSAGLRADEDFEASRCGQLRRSPQALGSFLSD
jgi:hypothetical protein